MIASVMIVVAALVVAAGSEPLPHQPVQVIASTGQPVWAHPGGATYADFGPPAVNSRGQMAFGALTERPVADGGGTLYGFGVFRREPDGGGAMLLHLDIDILPLGRQLKLDDEVTCAINGRGQVAAIGFGAGVPLVAFPLEPGTLRAGMQRTRSGQIVFGPAQQEGKCRQIVRAGDQVPGVEGDHVFHWFDCLSIDPEGTVYFRAGIAPRGQQPPSALHATIGCWMAAVDEEPVAMLVSGGRAPGCGEAERVRLTMMKGWRPGGVVVTGDVQAEGAEPGDPYRAATWVWKRATGLELMALAGHPAEGLEGGERQGSMYVVDIDDDGSPLFMGTVTRPNVPPVRYFQEATGIWARRADRTWLKIVEPGDPITDGDKEFHIVRVHSARWWRGGVLAELVVQGDAPAHGARPRGGLWLFREGAAAERVVGEELRPEGLDWPGYVFRPGGPVGVGPSGHVSLGLGYGRLENEGKLTRPWFNGVWLLTPEGEQRCVHLNGITMKYGPDKEGVPWRHLQDWHQSVSGRGEVALKVFFKDGALAIVMSPPVP